MYANGMADFESLHSRTMDRAAVACAFDLLMLDGDDLRRKPLAERGDQALINGIGDVSKNNRNRAGRML
jgi:ATP-dependent DNA ligase